MGLEKTIKGWLTEGRDLMVSQAKGRDPLVTKQTYQLPTPVCVLRPSNHSIKRVPAIEERYVRTVSDCIPTSHKRHRRRIRIQIISLYIYEFFVVCKAVQYVTTNLTWGFSFFWTDTTFSIIETVWLTIHPQIRKLSLLQTLLSKLPLIFSLRVCCLDSAETAHPNS